MDTQKPVEEQVQNLVDRVNDRKYYGRKMVVTIHTHSDDMLTFAVRGNLELSVSETPDDEKSWIDKKYSVMFIDNDPDQAIAEVFAHLNSIPMEYGDTIFEDDFEEVIKLVEAANDEVPDEAKEATIQ